MEERHVVADEGKESSIRLVDEGGPLETRQPREAGRGWRQRHDGLVVALVPCIRHAQHRPLIVWRECDVAAEKTHARGSGRRDGDRHDSLVVPDRRP